MSTRLGTSGEIVKLAHQLGVAPASLAFLSAVGVDDLRLLRSQIADALFNAASKDFSRVIAASGIVPPALGARITEHALPPLLGARIAELLEPRRAADMVRRLSARYLADAAVAMDPTRAPDVIAHLPSEQVAQVAKELAGRAEWVVMGGFASAVSEEALCAAVTVLTGEQLLRIGFVLDDLTRLDNIMAMLTNEQLDAILAATVERGLWLELDELVANLDDPLAEPLAARYAVADPSICQAIEAAAAIGLFSRESLGRLTSRVTSSQGRP